MDIIAFPGDVSVADIDTRQPREETEATDFYEDDVQVLGVEPDHADNVGLNAFPGNVQDAVLIDVDTCGDPIAGIQIPD